ncbi:putative membrane protein YmcC [Sphaerisporangium rufum]|uniref:Membrane protein YmcC n=1 Tax=Sphaerisporangium rufum TaxID=1381558 RepID=A0A919R5T5_9ACTN|nr:hypothetical protein [Sphaerisporangium rufum]GII80226.1 putative membrane protein YmcC [Sphaerisporangium rufum]
MLIAVIIACEIAFWVLLGLGLAARYLLKARRLSLVVLLVCVPLVDVALLAFSVVDLRGGGQAGIVHGLAAVYIGVSVGFGHRMLRWADQRFAHRFAGGPAPVRPPRTGREHAAHERRGWLRHLLAYLVGGAVMGIFTLLIGDFDRTAALWQMMRVWTIALVIDAIVSFSYTFSPRRART